MTNTRSLLWQALLVVIEPLRTPYPGAESLEQMSRDLECEAKKRRTFTPFLDTVPNLDTAATLVSARYYEVMVHLNPEDEAIANFATKEAAKLAITWAFETRKAELASRSDASDIRIDYDRIAGKENSFKIVWWQQVPGGYIAHKDYFVMVEKIWAKKVIGHAEVKVQPITYGEKHV